MLPVRVKTVSFSSCTLSEASALLQRFWCSDACSDSFARDYVANVAQALQDSKSRRSGGPESTGEFSAHLRFPIPSESPSRFGEKLINVKQNIFAAENNSPSPPHSKLFGHGKNNSLVAKNIVPSGLGDAHTDKKQSLPCPEDADASVWVGSVTEAEHAFERRKKKRGHLAVENGFETDLPHTSEIEGSALTYHDKRRKKDKYTAENVSVVNEFGGADDQRHHDRKRRKERQEMKTKKVETADHLALDSQSFDGKKRRMKEKQSKDNEDMETFLFPENSGSPVPLSHAKKKVEVSNFAANNVRVFVMPMSGTVEELLGPLKRKQKEGNVFLPATHFLGKEREEMNMVASSLEVDNPALDEKRKTKKKRRRKEDLGELFE